MSSLVTWFEAPPAPHERPRVLPSPFDDVAPHPLAQRAAEQVMAQLRAGTLAPGVSTAALSRPEGGKMFGVLVVEGPEGRVGFLKAFSGQLERAWTVAGYVPPLFDPALREAVEAPAELVVKGLTARVDAFRLGDELRAAREAVRALEAAQEEARAAMKARHREAKAARQRRREALAQRESDPRNASARTHRREEGARGEAPEPGVGSALRALATERPGAEVARGEELAPSAGDTLHALAQESRGDDAERRRAEAGWREALAQARAHLAPLERRLAALERLRRLTSQEAMKRILESYVLTNFRGEVTTLRALFPRGEPPSGAGDCAGPRLVGAARALGLRPLALAEFWWGAPPPAGARVEGMYFPACREKCGPVLPFLLEGLEVAPRTTWRPRPAEALTLEVRHEDAQVVVVEKPPGLLSVPARDAGITDSAWARLRARYPRATGPLLVHRLDLDTSGLLLAALDLATFTALQAQFVARTVEKTYLAWLAGVVEGAGTIELPLRVDLEQRPRQVVDFAHGKPAVTRWRALERRGAFTLVQLTPLTGRTHQLRVHCAHQLGLGVPLVGDRLYGQPAQRLLLQAQALAFTHPSTGARLEVACAAPLPAPTG